ncbi:hypothetical protein PROFUN_04055 [Planoprotostelium fungivorum]|uniref:Crossover junction endonuclease MUS81-like HHH domain-containing protein n=1 Tax=Planoprotostelium fungivorum TaxID=1890364 RepID=A0A2P6NW90_9EUKA|nr:hypothetical protein PROFUN_04055 [Planoprotostelium fungivorum]
MPPLPLKNPGNARLLQGLQRLESEKQAQSYGDKRYSTFAKAIQSVRNHPDVITSGKEATKLNGIAVVRMGSSQNQDTLITNAPASQSSQSKTVRSSNLTAVRMAHTSNHISPHPSSQSIPSLFIDSGYDNLLVRISTTSNHYVSPTAPPVLQSNYRLTSTVVELKRSEEEVETVNLTQRPKKKSGGKKWAGYCPAFRSGAWAVLICMFEDPLLEEHTGFMSKK